MSEGGSEAVLEKNGEKETLTIPEGLEPYFVEIEGETEGERIRPIRCRIVLKPDDKENKGGEKTPKQ